MMPPAWKANEQGKTGSVQRGVIAVIITILVLELKVPHGADLAALAPLIPGFMSYVLSFVFIGIYWNNHHHLMHAVRHVNGPVLWANLHLLFWLSLAPLVTAWMGENHFAPVPVALYGLVLLGAGMAYFILTRALLAMREAAINENGDPWCGSENEIGPDSQTWLLQSETESCPPQGLA
jgi:uncharacterized membrane protein